MKNSIKYDLTPCLLTAAYGRRYTTAEAAICAWNEGKDFCIYPFGPYTSKRDIELIRSEFPGGIHLIFENGIVKLKENND